MTLENHYFIAGDWGTSNLRLYLCQLQDSGPVLLIETRLGPGVSKMASGTSKFDPRNRQTSGDFEDCFFNLAQGWLDRLGAMPVILSGMVGSNIGWKQAPYLSCPVKAADIADGRICFSARGVEISILSGLRTTNPLQAPDIMRGEELQLLGWMLRNPDRSKDKRLFALPGTHNKWVWLEDAQIKTFLTAYTGELYGLLREHSILINDDGVANFNQNAFIAGVKAIESLGDGQLVHALFTTRSRQVLGEMPADDAPSYLSGLLIGADVQGAVKIFGKMTPEALPVTVIAEPGLSAHYSIALKHFGITAESCDTAEIALAGYGSVHQNIYASSN